MKLIDVFKQDIHTGLNFNSKINSPILAQLGFIDLRISVDMRDSNSLLKIQKTLEPHIRRNQQVFIVQSPLAHHNSILDSAIHGISEKLPYIVYFRKVEDPNLTSPLVYSLEEIRWKSYQYSQLSYA